jgi:thioredoxin 1
MWVGRAETFLLSFMTSSITLTLTKGNFSSEVLQSSAPVLVCFWAEWCGHCKTIAPVLGELVDQYEDRVKFGKINIDEQPALAAEYGVRSVPTLLLLRQGQVANQIVGLRSKRDIEDSFD